MITITMGGFVISIWRSGNLVGACAFESLEKGKLLCYCKGMLISYVIIETKRQQTGLVRVKIDLY